MGSWFVIAAIVIIFNKQEVTVEVGQIDQSLRVSEGKFGFGGGEGLPWEHLSGDPSIAIVRRLTDDKSRLEVRGVSPGNTGIPGPGGYYVRIKVVCGVEAPVIAEEAVIHARAGAAVPLRALAAAAERTTFQWYAGRSGDTSHPLAGGGTEVTYTPTASPKQYVWVLATTACTSSAAEFEIDVPTARTRAARH